MSDKKKNIILASGGTGGHIFPAESLAEELARRGYNPVLATDDRYKNYGASKKLDFRVTSAGMVDGGIFKLFSGIFNIGVGYMQAVRLLKELKPAVVVGFGGYPSFPTMYASIRKNYKTIIHEQNSTLGKANYVLAPKVDAIATSFSEVSGIQDRDINKVVLTGNPVRPAIKSLRDMQYPEFSSDGVLKILITGGSQGAYVFSEIVPKALKILPDELRTKIRIDQQCRKEKLEETRAAYKALGISADLSPFFNDMPARLASAHLVIARSGASTLAELTTVGRPAIMVPYPHAKDDHQRVNANSLEADGGGWVMPEETFTPEALSAKIEGFFKLSSILPEAAEKAKKAGRPDADKNLADLVEKLANAGYSSSSNSKRIIKTGT